MKSIAEREKQLKTRRTELDLHLHAIEDTLEEPVNNDVEERAVERELDEVLEGIGNVELHEVQMIDAALKRIADGEYGDCVKCSETISEDRLDIVPETPLCRHCAS